MSQGDSHRLAHESLKEYEEVAGSRTILLKTRCDVATFMTSFFPFPMYHFLICSRLLCFIRFIRYQLLFIIISVNIRRLQFIVNTLLDRCLLHYNLYASHQTILIFLSSFPTSVNELIAMLFKFNSKFLEENVSVKRNKHFVLFTYCNLINIFESINYVFIIGRTHPIIPCQRQPR